MLLTKSNCLLQILFLRKRHHHYYCCKTASKSTAQKFWVFFWLLNNGFPGTQYHLHQRVNHQIFRKVALTLCRVLLKVSKKGLHSTSVTSRLWRKKANLFFKLLIFILFFFQRIETDSAPSRLFGRANQDFYHSHCFARYEHQGR